MTEYFRLRGPDSDRWNGTDPRENRHDIALCPITEGVHQHRSLRRVVDLAVEVKHNDRGQWMIWAFLDGLVVHARLLEEFSRRGFTGYRLRPATVRFRDGGVSDEYCELVVTGWAGMAPPESGIVLEEACSACGHQRYTPLKHRDKLIDWSQWTGEDFFLVWPLANHCMITRRVADALAGLEVKSYGLENMLDPPRFGEWGYTVGPLSLALPEDLAVRYGAPLGLECETGCWPAAPSQPPAGAHDAPAPKLRLQPSQARELGKQVGREGANRSAAVRALLALAENDPKARLEVCHECLRLLEKGKIQAEELAAHAFVLVAVWDSAHAELKPRQRTNGSGEWLLDPSYEAPRALGEVVLDVLGYIPGVQVVGRLREALELADPRLKCFAVVSLLRRREEVDPAQIEAVAASLEMRMIFERMLGRLGRKSLMPARWAHPVELAASDLCQWASHPNELGAPPEEVELMQTVPVGSENGSTEDVYLFRFREFPKPWEAGEGWMAGIAGPVCDGESQDSPWSSFRRWDSMTPDEHFDKLYYRGSACARE